MRTPTLLPLFLTVTATALAADFLGAQCGTTVVSSAFNTTWTLAGSPYCVNATIAVGGLTIQPGVEVRLAPGVSLQVSSWLRAVGTREMPIVFRAQNLTAGRWGGIEFQGPVPPNNASQLENCVVVEAGNSGVRILDNDQVTLIQCAVRNNTSPQDGGGLRVALSSGSVDCFDCEIEGNRASRSGGGIHANSTGSGLLNLVGCRIRGNSISGGLGGIAYEGGGIRSAGNLSMTGCQITDNNTTLAPGCYAPIARGGGVHLSNGSVQIHASQITSNVLSVTTVCSPVGQSHGGGIFAESTVSSLVLTNCVVGCNTAAASAGGNFQTGSGILSQAASLTVTNCTIARNNGEGVRIGAGTANLANSIVFANLGPSLVGTPTANYCCIQGGFAGGTGNIPFNPQFVGTECVQEHFAVSQTSPCIDAGDPAPGNEDACRPSGQGTVRNDIGASGGSGNCALSGPATLICGAQRYGIGKQLPNAMSLDWEFITNQTPFPGNLTIASGFPNSPGILLLGLQPVDTPLSGITLLVDLGSATPLAIALDSAGAFSVPINLQIPFLVGFPLHLQAIALPASGQLRASNGLRLATCH